MPKVGFNSYIKEDNAVFITTAPYKNKAITFIIDEKDFNLVSKTRWHVNEKGYIFSNKYKLLHRYLLNYPSNQIDHINGDKIDNRRSNLRKVTSIQNNWNKILLGLVVVRDVNEDSCSIQSCKVYEHN